MNRTFTAFLLAGLLSGCDGLVGNMPDASDLVPDDAGTVTDAGATDAGGTLDAGSASDAGTITDAGVDAGAPDSGVPLGFGNRFGIGLVAPGSAAQLDLSANLAGPRGFVKLVFPGIEKTTMAPPAEWVNAIRDAYARDLIPVVRLGPPWGNRAVRNQSDDGTHLTYTQLAQAYRRVVEGLPRRDGWPLWLEIHNEPNLCYEWVCDAGSVQGGWMTYQQTAHEYATMLRDVVTALKAIGDPRLKLTNGGLAPGGARRCQCGTDGFEAGVTSEDFLREMKVQVPDVFTRLDGFASHSYPASGKGYGFFAPYEQSGVGLRYFADELVVVGRALPVLMTETGWTTELGASRDQIADWTERAYREFWLTDPRVLGVMPFMLQDPSWDKFAWVAPGGSTYPVYERVRALRCTSISGRCP